jgi:hypothetical protein
MSEVDRRVGVVDRRSPQLAGERAEWRRADDMARQSAPVGKDRRKPGVTDRRRQGAGEQLPGALTGLSADQLAYYVEEMRKVAARTGPASLEAADVLLWAFQQSQEHGTAPAGRELLPPTDDSADDVAGYAQNLTEDLDELHRETERARARVGTPEILTGWEGGHLRQRADNIGHRMPAQVREHFAEQIASARTAANTVADELEAAGFYGLLLKARDRAIHGPSRVAAIIAEADRATKELERRDKLTPELQQLVRQVKERAARYRWQKKMDEADVAEAGGNAKKAAKLRAEAGAVLAQDWPRAFPGEPLPSSP